MADENTPYTPPPGGPAPAEPAEPTRPADPIEPGASAPPPPPRADAPPPPPPGGTGGTGGMGGTGAGGPGGTGGPTPPPPPHGTTPPPGPPPGGGDNRQLMIVLSYLGILALVPYLAEQRDPEVRWHARNGLALFGADILITVVLWVVSAVMTAVFAPLGCLFSILWLFIGLALLAYHVFVMMKALKGERYRIPYVTEYGEKIP